jgi:hypothetical protein
MAIPIDFAVAVGLFLVFIAILFVYLVNYTTSYIDLTSTSELRTVVYDIFTSLFIGKGIPENWEEYNFTPVKVGLALDLYKVPILVTETNGTDRGYIILNVTIDFDANCENKTWNNTVRLYSSGEVPMQLQNQIFCSDQYLKKADVVFNASFSANENKTFFLFYSPDKGVAAPEYSFSFPSVSNFTFVIFPEEKLSTISITKLKGLRNLTYEEVLKTLGTEYKFNLEISEK